MEGVGAWRLFSWCPALAFAGAIFWSSSGPVPPEVAELVAVSDKLLHAAAYAVLAGAVAFALAVAHRLRPALAAVLAVAIATAYGAIDEWHQAFVPGRSSEVLDVVADAVGAAIGGPLLATAIVLREKRRKR